MSAYSRAMELVPDEATNGEAPFWVGVTFAATAPEEAMPYLRRAFAQDEKWADLIVRLPAAGLLSSQELAQDLADGMRRRNE